MRGLKKRSRVDRPINRPGGAPRRPDYAIGIDLGGSSIQSVAVTDRGKGLAKTRLDFDVDSDWAGRIREGVRQIESAQKRSAAWIGLSAPGLAEENGLSIAHMPGRLQGLGKLRWEEH